MSDTIQSQRVYSILPGFVLEKGDEENGDWIVYLHASNENTDQEGEEVKMAALQEARKNFLDHGVISWDHKHKSGGGPGFIIGEPLAVKFDDRKNTYVKAKLYQHNKIAQDLWNNIKSGAKRLGSSIGGGVVERANNVIKKVIWDELAITHKPVNDDTLEGVQMIPFAAFSKALSAGSGADATTFTGGRAITPESLAGAATKARDLDGKAFFHSVFRGIKNRSIATYNDLYNFVYEQGYDEDTTKTLLEFVVQKFLTMSGGKLKEVFNE